MPFALTLLASLGWGLQFAFLMPALALLLVEVYGASSTEIGVVLVIFNTAGLIASTAIPVLADRSRNYAAPLLLAAVLTLALVGALASTSSLVLATVALVVLGAPAGIGFVMLFALLRNAGVSTDRMMQARAAVSFAWVAGPPLATLVMDRLGPRSVFVLIAGVALVNLATSLALSKRARVAASSPAGAEAAASGRQVGWGRIVTFMVVFALLQATNTAGVAVMGLYVTQTLGTALVWAGIVLGVAALLEIPGLLALGRIEGLFPVRSIMLTGCVAGVAYYALMATASGVVVAMAAQVLNALFYAVIAGLGLTLFQRVIERPGLATALYSNANRVGSILSGGLIVAGTATPFGYAGVHLVSAVVVAVTIPVAVVALRRV